MKLSQILLEDETDELGAELQDAFEDELEDGELNEALPVIGVLSWALASNTVLDILGKYVGKALRKLNLNKAADKATAISKWAHENEKKMISTIDKSITPFVKDAKKRDIIAQGFFIAVLSGLGFKAGVGAINALRKAKLSKAGLAATKAALKGRDISHVGKTLGARAAEFMPYK
tara:strand:+ start:3496 stop:4020 length:525 start_codon:yes stop_codon:yes gene_type:complete